jgi:hypothetical protein
MAALRWICRTRWFRGIDYLVYYFPYFGLKAYTLMPDPFPDSWIVTSWLFHYYISAIRSHIRPCAVSAGDCDWIYDEAGRIGTDLGGPFGSWGLFCGIM